MIDIEKCNDDHIDDHVDEEIFNCLNLKNLKSFFLFAGAGSGKTRTLVSVLERFRDQNYQQLQLNGQRIAIITFTNAACEEIQRRLDYDPLFSVSTIHSFIWELIREFDKDIREWLDANLNNQIDDLKLQLSKGRKGTKTYVDRVKSLEIKEKRINNLENIKHFTYNPSGLNQSKESLSHSEVISIGAYFLTNKPLMGKILVRKFPILLIDESQDTNKELINAFFEVERKNNNIFSLGLFGDTMQRIYSDGEVNLGNSLPDSWSKPVKKMNHRCPPRVIKLINKIRSTVDGQEQRERTDKNEGFVHMFILHSKTDKRNAEKKVVQRMAEITGDPKWEIVDADYTTLILEHHMAANRLGFIDMFEPLYKNDKLKTGLLDGSLSGLQFFTRIILPIVEADEIGDKLKITNITREYSNLLKFQKGERDQLLRISKARGAVDKLLSLWDDSKDPTCIDILQCVAELNLFEIPDSIFPLSVKEKKEELISEEITADGKSDVLIAWFESLNAPFSQIRAYDSYINDKSRFMTHQGVKGLEFPRVMVIIDDSEARGFLFSYEKLFGVKDKTEADKKNENEGKDTSIDRTRRLFYVTCSRAEESLAIVAYSTEPELVKKHVIQEGWFNESEVEILNVQ
ncbi:UvrD-helicase domain-containing protein [Schinkia azotoformans]|uniref:Pathogenesis-like protein n=1 Tax=Schinkia azotoformans LMG 9581 TaxID=1131731 RepID=K6BVV5_SCHAZ|nr:UvrD-helicase domain-containing protein [Schinkia azotoformans]EKN63040.1 pathogenesis-like protein [Schinkia azotoformans LMG 9581]MEC1639104.1 UvrD-helicase domain-containing protein [Schinkia azotoformans]MEC1945133.1 UvrD-helicase domain-containing protein [Schinkia azotoformans]